ncbi:hypothetical protein Tsubulata_017061 [Turnera subulata]|uniref:NAC domain-containing protein n=1 Tax=Turnera subulata TaxID=218843 RepID=A0A9Q0EY68_9ROSI|nr:hypothetical protein Tsubulata_017061 [Turnera subulata]
MAQVLPSNYPSSQSLPITPKPPRRPLKRKRSPPPQEEEGDGDGDDGHNRNRHRNPDPHQPTATAQPPPPPPPCSNSLPSWSKDPYVKALGQFGVHLPPGYYFTPSVDELVGHYLLRKINGTLLPIDAALIPDCDVYGDEEPWEIWSRFRRAVDDHRHSLFLLTRLKKRSRRIGTDGGTWHEESKKRHPVNGMIIKAVERHFTYRNISSPNSKFPWLLKEFTLDNYPGADFAVCELRKKGCNSAVRPPDSGPSFAPPPTSHPVSQSDSSIFDLVEDSEAEAGLGRALISIGSTPTSPQQLEETDDVPGKDEEGLINLDAASLLESFGDLADELQVVYDGALIGLEFAPPKAKAQG